VVDEELPNKFPLPCCWPKTNVDGLEELNTLDCVWEVDCTGVLAEKLNDTDWPPTWGAWNRLAPPVGGWKMDEDLDGV